MARPDPENNTDLRRTIDPMVRPTAPPVDLAGAAAEQPLNYVETRLQPSPGPSSRGGRSTSLVRPTPAASFDPATARGPNRKRISQRPEAPATADEPSVFQGSVPRALRRAINADVPSGIPLIAQLAGRASAVFGGGPAAAPGAPPAPTAPASDSRFAPGTNAGFPTQEPEILSESEDGPLSGRDDVQTAVPDATPTGEVGNVSFGPMVDPKTGKPMMARTVVPGDRPGTTRIVETPVEGYSGRGGPDGVTVTRDGLQRQFDAGGFEGGSLTAKQEAKRAADASSMFWNNLGYASAQDYQNQRRGAPPVSEVGDVNTQLRLLDFQRKLQNDQAKMLQNATEAERKAFGDAQQLASTNPAAFMARYDAELKRMTPQQQKAFLATPVGSLLRSTALGALQSAWQQGAGWWTNLANPEQAGELTLGDPMEFSPGGVAVGGPTVGPDFLVRAATGGDVRLSRGELQQYGNGLTIDLLRTLNAADLGVLGEEEERR